MSGKSQEVPGKRRSPKEAITRHTKLFKEFKVALTDFTLFELPRSPEVCNQEFAIPKLRSVFAKESSVRRGTANNFHSTGEGWNLMCIRRSNRRAVDNIPEAARLL